MKILNIFILLLSSLNALGQDGDRCNFQRLFDEGKRFARQERYDDAILTYNSARSCDPTQSSDIDKAIKSAIKGIKKQKEYAEEQRRIAEDQTKIAERETKIAIEQKNIVNKQLRTSENNALAFIKINTNPTLSVRTLKYVLGKDSSNSIATSIFTRVVSDSTNQFYINSFDVDSSDISAASISPDGKKMVIGTKSGVVKLWDIENRKILLEFIGHTGWVLAVKIDADGKYFLTGSDDKTVKMWNILSGEFIREFKHEGRIISLDSNGKLLVTGTDKNVFLWDLTTAKSVHPALEVPPAKMPPTDVITTKNLPNLVYSVAISHNGKRIAAGCLDGTVMSWEIKIKRKKYEIINSMSIKGHTITTQSVALSSDGMFLVTGGGDMTAKIWDIKGNLKHTYKGHNAAIVFVTLSADGKRLVTTGIDNKAVLWDVESERPIRIFKGHKQMIIAVHLSLDGQKLLTLGSDKTLKEWNTNRKNSFENLITQTDNVGVLALSNNGKWLVTNHGAKANLWDIEKRKIIKPPYSGHSLDISSIVFSTDNKRFVTGGFDGKAILWDIDNVNPIMEFPSTPKQPITSVAISRDGKSIATAHGDGNIKLWGVANGKVFKEFNNLGTKISFALHDDWEKIVTNSGTSAKLWDATNGILKCEFKGISQGSIHFILTADGKKIVTGSRANGGERLKVWDLESGSLIKECYPSNASSIVSPLSINDEDGFLITGGSEKIVRIWDLKTGEVLRELNGHISSVKSAAISADSKIIVSCSEDKIVKIWCLDIDCNGVSDVHHFSLKELRAEGVKLEPEDLLKLKEEGEILTTEELDLIKTIKN
jgi:WD40 repeat protein